jgi:predicted ATP-grasp superfamily ATP-dependent carboligase
VTYAERPDLNRPPVICAFRGWNDGGEAASMAAGYLVERWGGRPIARIDPEEFYDFQVNRPTVRLENGVSRVVEWPECVFAAASAREGDVVVFTAPEPNNRWRGFVDSVVGVARELRSGMLITLGAFLTDVPHTRPVPVVGSAQDEETAGSLGLSRSRYEGPTGIVGVLHDASNRSGIPSISLWAAVPHYLPTAPNPKAALALVQRATALLGIPVDTAPLAKAADTWEQSVARMVEDNDELAEYVGRLEAAAHEVLDQDADRDAAGQEPVPSGDAIAAEVERYLREQGEGN